MCIICLIQLVGGAAMDSCGSRQGEYRVGDDAPKPAGRDWRSLLCCCSRGGKHAVRGNMVFMHGVIYLEVIAGKDLPDVDTSWFRSSKDVSDPYVTVDICKGGKKTCRLAKTSIIYNSLNPVWSEKFRVELCHEAESLLFTIKDLDLVNIECMGYMSILAEDLISEEPITGWFPVTNRDGMAAGSLNVSLQYRSSASMIHSYEVLDTVFPMREGCHVTLYQDAHTPACAPIADVPGPRGEAYTASLLWVDVAAHLEAAEKLIYVVGWSVKADIPLERCENSESLGQILKRKAQNGVRVLVLVWNEALSTDIYTPGLMGTHDEETRMYFDDSEVEVVLAPRTKSKGKIFEDNFVATCYTHHQKCVILDAPVDEDSSQRCLVAFVGGIDLTDGRWDTPEHPLYKTLLCEHSYDFYNGCCSSAANIGPRQPWHDIHARVEGPVVLDFITNFVERWRKQAPDREIRLLNIGREFCTQVQDKTSPSWNVQLFRSINSDSAQFYHNITDRLLSRKGRLYENSIQQAYIHHIRRAKKFIYIENQYFLGSSHGWLVPEAKCNHLIPAEIATRIVSAIMAGEDFRVYIIVPLHPEGDPTSSAVQEILHWQHRTMEMMYRRIAKALTKMDSSAHPTDYLGFFCLGKRESREEVPEGLEAPEEGSVAAKVRESLRFMIYVHSKMAIFDDTYIITGSANINERSMSGNRDTEIAVGAYQPDHTEEAEGGDISGDVRSFRLSLWAEHCGVHMEEHLCPSSFSCMDSVREMATRNLEQFLIATPEHNDSHILLYPISVSADGHVTTRGDCEEFPDTAASVLGKNSQFLPNSLTT